MPGAAVPNKGWSPPADRRLVFQGIIPSDGPSLKTLIGNAKRHRNKTPGFAPFLIKVSLLYC